jgi:hypothetical protein
MFQSAAGSGAGSPGPAWPATAGLRRRRLRFFGAGSAPFSDGVVSACGCPFC